jgi:uncharacterized protein with NAD-binding domain and iron-sulfur cluster
VAASDKKRVVILGGGPSALATAFELTSGELADAMRSPAATRLALGGKCASGRGANERIEEHGLHVWFGSYDNAFRPDATLLRRARPRPLRDTPSPRSEPRSTG